MICYSGIVVTLDHVEKAGADFDHGPEFGFDQVHSIVKEELDDWGFVTERMIQNGDHAIAFLIGSNHDRGARSVVEHLFERLSEFGNGLYAYCALHDDEANDGNGGHWEFRLNDIGLDNQAGAPIILDFSRTNNT